MPTSDQDLRSKQEHVEKLRSQVAEANAHREERERSLANDVTAAQLDTEAARLEAELIRSREMAKAGTVKLAASPLASAQADMKAAVEARKFAEQQTKAAAKASDDDKNREA